MTELSKAYAPDQRYMTTLTLSKMEVELACPKHIRALVALMDLAAVNGGAASHWGGPAALAEAMSALHALMISRSPSDWTDRFNFVNDVGHAENGLYALRAILGIDNMTVDDLKGFRSIESKLTGHGESHLNPEQVLLSNGPLGSAVPQAQGLAIADRMSGNDRVTVCVMSDGAAMEGEAREAFASIPGLAAKGKMNPFVLIISDNNTKLSGRIDADSFSMAPTFDALAPMGWDVVEISEGNNLEVVFTELARVLEQCRGQVRPVAIRLKTVKGYGVKKTAESASGGHGFPIKPYSADIVGFVEEILGGSIPSDLNDWVQELQRKPEASGSKSDVVKEKAQAGFARAMIDLAKDGLPIVSVSADLQGSTGVAPFRKEFPDQSIEVGIAESNMVSVAAGMSRLGYIPVVDTFAAFGVTKGNLPIIMAELSNSPVIAVFSHTGFQDAADGASHQSLTYMSALASIPGVQLVNACCSRDAYELMNQAARKMHEDRKNGHHVHSVIFYVGRENFPAQTQTSAPKWGELQELKTGEKVAIVATGPMVWKALEAAEELAKEGINAAVVQNAFANSTKVDALKNYDTIVTVEDHQMIGGMGQMLGHSLLRLGHTFKMGSLAVQGEFGRSAYKADQLYDQYGLSSKHIVEEVKRLS